MDLILFPFHDYKKWIKEGFRTRDAHLFQSFERSSKVDRIVIFNRPVSTPELILKKNWITDKNKVILNKNKISIQQFSEKVYVIDMLIDDISVIWLKKLWWKKVYEKSDVINKILFVLNYLNISEVNLLLQNPMCAPILDGIQGNISIFDGIDNWLEHPQMNKFYKEIKESYNTIDQKVNYITMVSQSIAKIFNRNDNIFWIPNGVDIDYFNISTKVNRPVSIGYAGKIQSRLDFNLVEELLINFPENNFLFFGPVLDCQDKVNYLNKKFKNITFYGDIHYDELPEKFDLFEIGIIPHAISEFTNSMNPLKLYEFLAAGKPVVSTGVSGVNDVSKYVYISGSYTEFINNLNNLIFLYNSENIRPENVSDSLSKKHLWDSKAEQILSLFER